MSYENLLIWSCIAMVLLTMVVALRMLSTRVAEIKSKQLRLKEIATSNQLYAKLENVQAADNYRNLFESPVLFYLLCVLLLVTHKASAVFAVLAWAYVLTRVVHSYIHCTHNRVRYRFQAFMASGAVLMAMWLWFAIQMLSPSLLG